MFCYQQQQWTCYVVELSFVCFVFVLCMIVWLLICSVCRLGARLVVRLLCFVHVLFVN